MLAADQAAQLRPAQRPVSQGMVRLHHGSPDARVRTVAVDHHQLDGAKQLDQHLDDGRPDAAALDARGLCAQPVEGLEGLRQALRRDAQAGVGDPDQRPPAAGCPQRRAPAPLPAASCAARRPRRWTGRARRRSAPAGVGRPRRCGPASALQIGVGIADGRWPMADGRWLRRVVRHVECGRLMRHAGAADGCARLVRCGPRCSVARRGSALKCTRSVRQVRGPGHRPGAGWLARRLLVYRPEHQAASGRREPLSTHRPMPVAPQE